MREVAERGLIFIFSLRDNWRIITMHCELQIKWTFHIEMGT